jgi:hypothetical protein
MKTKISLIIPVFNGRVHLQKSLPSLLRQIQQSNTLDCRIIVVDDKSSDGTALWLNDTFPEIIVLHGDGNLWWSGGVNRGIEWVQSHADSRFVLLWNHDTECADDYFEQLGTLIQTIPPRQIVTSKVYFLDRPDVIFNFGCYYYPVTGVNVQHGYGMQDGPSFHQPTEVDWTGGMGTLIPMEVFLLTGLFDAKHFPQYYGDCDFFLRARKKGYSIFAYPQLRIWNDKSHSGLEHKGKWSLYWDTLFSLRSNHNLKVQWAFVTRHATSPLAYANFFYGWGIHTGSFLKHWILRRLRIKP